MAGGPSARSICLDTPSADPSGMGAHLLDLVAEYVEDADVSVLAWPTAGGQRLLAQAAAVGTRSVALPHPRAAAFGPAIAQHLGAHPADVFHLHVGTGREDFDGARAARAAGVPGEGMTAGPLLTWGAGTCLGQVLENGSGSGGAPVAPRKPVRPAALTTTAPGSALAGTVVVTGKPTSGTTAVPGSLVAVS